MRKITLSLLICLAGAGSAPVLADCPLSTTIREVTDAYSKGQAFEKAGKNREALSAYVRAQAETCDPNPVAARAAGRAAVLSLPLAQAAQAKGDHQAAFDLFESGAHFAQADRELVAILHSNPDDPSLFERARLHFDARGEEWFQANNRERIAAAGAYKVDAALIADVKSVLTQGVERALQREASAFNEVYLNDYVRLTQSIPDDPADLVGLQRAGTDQQAFAAKWPRDLMKEGLDAMDLVRRWSSVAVDPAQRASVDARRTKRIEERTTALSQRFNGSPKLLELAMDYQRRSPDRDAAQVRIAKVKAQALKLGDAATQAKRLVLALSYYDVADADDKTAATREKLNAQAQAAFAPRVEQMKRDAAALQREFSDPKRVEEMRRQAEAAKAAVTQSKPDTESRKKQADDLEKDLGL